MNAMVMRGVLCQSSKSRGSGARTLEWLVVLGVAVVLAWVLRWSAELVRADLAFIEPRHQIAQWIKGRERYTAPQWYGAYKGMRQAIALSPGNPVLHEYMGALLALRGQSYWHSEVLRRAFYGDARRHQLTSLRLRPGNGRTWAGLALSQHALSDDPRSVARSINWALQYSPHDSRVQRQMAALVLARWAQAEPAQRNWVRRLYRDEKTRHRLQLQQMAKRYGVRFV